LMFGACLCLGSVALAASDLLFKQHMKVTLKLSSVEAMGYMALPAFLLMLLPGFLWVHPVPSGWATHLGAAGAWSDAAVLSQAVQLRPEVLVFVALSGVLAFGYNIFTTYFTGKLSATTVSLVGNFPTTILISLLFLEKTPPHGMWGALLWASILGNVVSFAAYSSSRQKKRLKLVASDDFVAFARAGVIPDADVAADFDFS
ncbi:unnamed protein product, partial [Polarella glacialis]